MTDRGVFMRMMLVVLVILTVWVGLGFRLFQLHLGKNGALKARIAQLRHMEKPLLAGRGAILDANRIPLALNAKLKNVWVDPHRILLNRQGEAVSLLLANVLGLDRGKLSRIINQPDRYFEYIKRNVNGDQIEKLQRMKIRGVYLEDTNMRYYPHGSMLCHVLGFTSRFGESFYGIEQHLVESARNEHGGYEPHRFQHHNRCLANPATDQKDLPADPPQHVQRWCTEFWFK